MDDDDEVIDTNELFHRLRHSMHESIDAILDDEDHARLVVHGTHTALLLMMIADTAGNMSLSKRAELYDTASVIIIQSVLGKADAVMSVMVSEMVDAASNN